MSFYVSEYFSPLGKLTIICDGNAIIHLALPSSDTSHFTELLPGTDIPTLNNAIQWLTAYFAGQHPSLQDLPLSPKGTPFQLQVWKRLSVIPYGETVTYGQLAAELAQARGVQKMSAQAIGQAVGANPIGIIIPCHRVIGANGRLGGYSGGIENKIWLLQHEEAL